MREGGRYGGRRGAARAGPLRRCVGEGEGARAVVLRRESGGRERVEGAVGREGHAAGLR